VKRLYHIFSTLNVGGPQRRFATLVDGLEGYEHYVSAVDENYTALDLIEGRDKIHIHPLGLKKSRLISLTNMSKIAKAVKAIAPAHLLTYNWGSIEAAFALRLGLEGLGQQSHLHFEDGFGPDESITAQKKQRVWMRRLCLSRHNSKIIVPSQTLLHLATKVWGFAGAKIIHISNGIDLDHFHLRPPSSGNHLTIGTVCALRREKNLERLIDVVMMLPRDRTSLMIVGDGPERQPLEAYGARSGVAIDFKGHQPDPACFYQQMDVFALTSDTEQMPLGVLEAMASGLPVVATNVGDVATMVDETNQSLIKILGDDTALAEAIESLRENIPLRRKVGAQNRAKAEQYFSQAQMLRRYDQLLSIGGDAPSPEGRA